MDWERLASIGVAALCMTAIGVAATTFDSTVSQTPDDLVDFSDSQLPIGDDSTGDVDQQIERNKQSQSNDDDGGAGGQEGDEPTAGDPGDGEEQADDDPGSGTEAQQPDGGSGQGPGPGPGPGPGESLLQRLLDLLAKLLPVLLALVALALAYRYRDRLLGILAAPLALLGGAGARRRAGPDRDPWADADPPDDVARAWYAMVRDADVERPWAKTPDECRDAAVASGLDPDAVETLTGLFRERRYASGAPSDAHEERARNCLESLDLGRGVR